MGIDLDQRHVFVLRQGAQDRDRDTVVTAQRDQRRTGIKDHLRCRLRPPVVFMGVKRIGRHIAEQVGQPV